MEQSDKEYEEYLFDSIDRLVEECRNCPDKIECENLGSKYCLESIMNDITEEQ